MRSVSVRNANKMLFFSIQSQSQTPLSKTYILFVNYFNVHVFGNLVKSGTICHILCLTAAVTKTIACVEQARLPVILSSIYTSQIAK